MTARRVTNMNALDRPAFSPDAILEAFTKDLASPPVWATPAISTAQGATPRRDLVFDVAYSVAEMVAACNAGVLRQL